MSNIVLPLYKNVLSSHVPVSVHPDDVPINWNRRLGNVGPGCDAKKRSKTANSWASVVMIGTALGVKAFNKEAALAMLCRWAKAYSAKPSMVGVSQ